jgi:AcrR family transcriptional regulator
MPDQPARVGPRGGRTRRGRAPTHTIRDITSAAIAIADEDGLAGVTMREVGRSIGAGAASLYRYVSTRDELVALMVDQVNGEFDLTSRRPGSWPDGMLALGHQAREIYRRHPWMIEALDSTPTLGPNGYAFLEHSLDTLSQTGSSGRTKLEAVGVFSGLVRLLAKAERDEQQAASSLADARTQQLVMAAADGSHPRLAEALAESTRQRAAGDVGSGAQGQFDRILRRVLIGLLTE